MRKPEAWEIAEAEWRERQRIHRALSILWLAACAVVCGWAVLGFPGLEWMQEVER